MITPRDVLNKLKWTEGERIEDAEIFYVHRGAPDNSRSVMGNDIVQLDRFCFELATGSCIPYHRVYKIAYRGRIIFERYKGNTSRTDNRY